jgi:hypothetical protein
MPAGGSRPLLLSLSFATSDQGRPHPRHHVRAAWREPLQRSIEPFPFLEKEEGSSKPSDPVQTSIAKGICGDRVGRPRPSKTVHREALPASAPSQGPVSRFPVHDSI